MSIDTDAELHDHEAEGWQAGLYADVRQTFRAPIVNWIFRTLVANEPAATRYLWGQVKPLFTTAACLAFVEDHQTAVRSAVDPPRVSRADLELDPAEFRELQGQLATFDAVVPRLALLFEVADRSLGGEPPEAADDPAPAATQPHGRTATPPDRRPPTMATVADSRAALPETIEHITAFHGLEDGLPSVYRCLAQWPDALRATWATAEPALESAAFEAATDRTATVTEQALGETAYTPRLAPADFERLGLDGERIDALASLFAEFNRGAIETVLPAVHVFAGALDAESPPSR